MSVSASRFLDAHLRNYILLYYIILCGAQLFKVPMQRKLSLS